MDSSQLDQFFYTPLNRQEEKATRADDAAIPYDLWDNKIWGLGYHNADNRLKRNSASLGVLDVLHRVCWASFWEWCDGSALIYWRWPESQQLHARKGRPVWILSDLPRYLRPQPQEKNLHLKSQVAIKLSVIRAHRYVEKSRVSSLTSYFPVPKGEKDVRIVYNASRSGLNKCLWVPSFHLPAPEALVQAMDFNFWMGNLDLGEMFLNFPLDITLRPFYGIDLKPYIEDVQSWERWVQCMMGLKPSPYLSTKSFHLANKVVLGDHLDPTNAFFWIEAILICPVHRSTIRPSHAYGS